MYRTSGAIESENKSIMHCIHIVAVPRTHTHGGNAGYCYREVADTKARCMRGVSTVNPVERPCSFRVLSDIGASNGMMIAAERAPDQIHYTHELVAFVVGCGVPRAA